MYPHPEVPVTKHWPVDELQQIVAQHVVASHALPDTWFVPAGHGAAPVAQHAPVLSAQHGVRRHGIGTHVVAPGDRVVPLRHAPSAGRTVHSAELLLQHAIPVQGLGLHAPNARPRSVPLPQPTQKLTALHVPLTASQQARCAHS